jgi:arginyl-tRNA synthetase
MRERIEKAVKESLKALGAEGVSFVIERPSDLSHGDYSTNAALVASKPLEQGPRQVAEALAGRLGAIEGVASVSIAGPGFINFTLTRESLLPNDLPLHDVYKGKHIMVEYTDPNPFKEFHIGHLMSNAIGESIARLLAASGAAVVRANYQGDVGPHVAKAIWGKLQKPQLPWGEAYTFGAKEYESHKDEIDAINKKVYEKSDSEINALYDAGRKESLERFEEIYKKLGTKFDHYFFESETGPKGLAIVAAHPEVFQMSEGATVFHGAHTRVFVNSKGLPTYEAKELGLAEIKRSLGLDEYVYVTASEQNGFFEVVFDAIQKVFPDLVGKLAHRSHGMMRFASGKMSSREGNVVTGELLLEDMKKAARDREDVAVGAVKYSVLKSGSGKDIIFDLEKSLSLEGDSGPYLQYALVRARSLLRAAKEAGVVAGTDDAPAEATTLERILLHYPEVVERAAKELEPHYVTTYLTELASAFNSWYASGKVIGGERPRHGVLLAGAAEKTLAQGLGLLGIPTPEEM